MAVTINYQNNYGKLKEDFKNDTGLDANKSIPEYIAYYNARMNDKQYQMDFQLAEIFLNKIDQIPDIIRLRIAEMITSHPVIKELLKK